MLAWARSSSAGDGLTPDRGTLTFHVINEVRYHSPMATQKKQTPAVHPGEVLDRQYLEPLGVSQYRLAKDISVPARRVNEIVLGKRAISADTALRFARYFGTTEAYWMDLQAKYDVEMVRAKLGPRLAWEVVVRR